MRQAVKVAVPSKDPKKNGKKTRGVEEMVRSLFHFRIVICGCSGSCAAFNWHSSALVLNLAVSALYRPASHLLLLLLLGWHSLESNAVGAWDSVPICSLFVLL